jgi:biopolymer transport protein ExbD
MRFYTRQRRMPTVIIVSLIDIFAILLIFVIVTTTFKRVQPEVVIKLPESATAEPSAQSESPALLTISKDGKVFLEDAPMPMGELKAAIEQIAKAKPERRFAMKADEGTPFGTIIQVLDALKQAGVGSKVSAFTDEKK